METVRKKRIARIHLPTQRGRCKHIKMRNVLFFFFNKRSDKIGRD